jgi:hypothetical protein
MRDKDLLQKVPIWGTYLSKMCSYFQNRFLSGSKDSKVKQEIYGWIKT